MGKEKKLEVAEMQIKFYATEMQMLRCMCR